MAASWQTTYTHLNSLIVERAELMLTDTPVFPERLSFQYKFTNTTSADHECYKMPHALWKSYHNCILEPKASLADWAFLHHLAKILMMK